MNSVSPRGAFVRRFPVPEDLTGHNRRFVTLMKGKAAQYEIWAIPQSGGAWLLLFDGEPLDWAWKCRDEVAAVSRLKKMAKTVAAIHRIHERYWVLHDRLRAPGGTRYDCAEDSDDPNDGGES